GIVETIAHYTAAKHFNSHVDFILDIGGQDIKCFKIRNRSIDSIMLNEACSSGCGSFIETFAKSMGYRIDEFSKLGLFAKSPVDLGTRCTVFMNSSVKQAQKDGATVEDISAGLSMSVVKNAIYKVIRASSPDELGQNIVVQGGTFLNDAVLRCFEREIGREVIRPTVAGLMGAYGAALYSKSVANGKSAIISPEELQNFTHKSKAAVCGGCTNNCRLTVNIFSNGEKFISGNQCEKGLGGAAKTGNLPNMYEIKRGLLAEKFETQVPNSRGVIGLPLSLGMYELYPLWHGIFTALGFSVKCSGFSDRALYSLGQFSIPSDTACYPAKIMHGHIEKLVAEGVDAVFYPCLSYNIDEKRSANHYNCPVVAYYSELLNGNTESLKKTKFIYPYLNVNNPRQLAKELYGYLGEYFDGITLPEIRRAVKCGFAALKEHSDRVFHEGQKAIAYAKEQGKRIMILAGRPYHIDPEICHGIDKLAASLGFVVVSEDCVAPLAKMPKVNVLNQWTYHARLYAAAQYTAEHDDTELVQLVSFGCGVDAITTDEVRAILERNNKLYTQIKIDEITNLGAVKIRLRSLIGALNERENGKQPTER
ncbi:MAG: acyl-CoA dehydratase activase-related protein, partial [Acutalibacteraceae bacterium]